MKNSELYNLILKMKENDLEATFDIITEFKNVIYNECYINNRFNLECRDYIVEQLIKNMKNFKNI